jgi:hypothetical protein
MMTDPYLIRLHGGRFDGYRQSVNYILLDTRLEMPGTLPCPDDIPSPPRAAVYELRRASIEILDGLPTMVLNYHFVGMRVGMVSAQIKRLAQWKDRLAQRVLRITGTFLSTSWKLLRRPRTDVAFIGRHPACIEILNPKRLLSRVLRSIGQESL